MKRIIAALGFAAVAWGTWILGAPLISVPCAVAAVGLGMHAASRWHR